MSMAKSTQPSVSAQRKPTSSSDDLVKAGKKDSTELTDNELSKVVGGVSEIVITKSTDSSSPH
jgi:bacteriocin-like protein